MIQLRNNCFIFRTIFYNEPITLREISRIAKCSISKVSRMIKMLLENDLVNIDVKGKSYLVTPNLKNRLVKYVLLNEEIAYTLFSIKKYPYLMNIKEKGEIMLIFGSHAEHKAIDLSDIDVLVINGKGRFSLTIEEFRKKLYEKNCTLLSILKKHIIVKGFERFVDEVIRWKKKLYGVHE